MSAYKDRWLLEAYNDKVWRSIENTNGNVSWLHTYVIDTDFRETLCLIHTDATVDHRDPVAESDVIIARSRNDVIIRGPFLWGGHTQKSLHATHGGCLRFHSVCRDLTPTLVAETVETRKMLGKRIAYRWTAEAVDYTTESSGHTCGLNGFVQRSKH